MRVRAHLLRSFTQDPSGGNPAAVVDADDLSDEEMLAIARALGLSESAFVQKSVEADLRVRFFAAAQETDFCGHAVVATFHSLVERGRIRVEGEGFVEVTQETRAGVLPVACHSDGKIMMTQADPTFGAIATDRHEISALLGLREGDLAGDLPVQTVSTGSPKLMVPVGSFELLDRVSPDLAGISRFCAGHGPRGFYAFTTETTRDDADLSARFFDPTIGIEEDPATGVAAGALACYADRYMSDPAKTQYTIEQGLTMGSPGTIYVDTTSRVQVGGYAAGVGERVLDVEPPALGGDARP